MTMNAVTARLAFEVVKTACSNCNLREANRKLMTFTQVSRALQQELDVAHAINRRLLEPKGRSGPLNGPR